MRTRLFPLFILLLSLTLCLTAFFLPIFYGCNFEMISAIFSPVQLHFMLLAVAAAAGTSLLFRILLHFKNKYNWKPYWEIRYTKRRLKRRLLRFRRLFAEFSGINERQFTALTLTMHNNRHRIFPDCFDPRFAWFPHTSFRISPLLCRNWGFSGHALPQYDGPLPLQRRSS